MGAQTDYSWGSGLHGGAKETAGGGSVGEEAQLRVCLCLPSTQMKKVMLTVFKHNRGAYQFFREALQ